MAGLARVMAAGGIETHNAAGRVHDLQPPADMHSGGGNDVALFDHGELGGAAADVDVENALVVIVRDARRARAVGGQHRLHVMAGGGA